MGALEITLIGTIGLFVLGIICSTVEKCYYFYAKSQNPEAFKYDANKENKN
jgi:hypothetical protein